MCSALPSHGGRSTSSFRAAGISNWHQPLRVFPYSSGKMTTRLCTNRKKCFFSKVSSTLTSEITNFYTVFGGTNNITFILSFFYKPSITWSFSSR